MFEHLKKYDIILVTGPQRSGTQICARIIAHDTGHTYVDEGRFNVWNYNKAVFFAEENKPCVVHGPGIFEHAHLFDNVVVMKRDVREIGKSLEKMPALYNKLITKYPEVLWCTDRKRHLAVLMYTVFYHGTIKWVKNLIEVNYDILDQHPFWVPKKQRVEWKTKQWKN